MGTPLFYILDRSLAPGILQLNLVMYSFRRLHLQAIQHKKCVLKGEGTLSIQHMHCSFSQDDASKPAEEIRRMPNVDFYAVSMSHLNNLWVTSFDLIPVKFILTHLRIRNNIHSHILNFSKTNSVTILSRTVSFLRIVINEILRHE